MTISPTRTQLQIGQDELRDRLERRDPIMILDVREQADRDEWSIPESVHVDVYQALKAGDTHSLDYLDVPAGTEVVTVCALGKTAVLAAEQLQARGIKARALTGGMKTWSLAWNTADVPLSSSTSGVVQVRRTGKGCLSYLIGSAGVAAVIDPTLEPEVYEHIAEGYGWNITHVFETHIHADHLMRSRLLAEQTGATLYLPQTDRVTFPFTAVENDDLLALGTAKLRVIATPGHTPESVSYLLDDEAIFTGDTLFLTGVGRPDLDASPEQAQDRAHVLFSALRTLQALPDATIVLPGHTSQPVSFDGVPLRATLGELQAGVPMLQLEEEEFVQTILARVPPTPPNHHRIVALNESGTLPAGDPTDLEAGANRCAVS